ncbi:Plug domain-containing protein [Acidithiobacillus sp. IBUN Pt1247-S3]|uniref:Plug domain-containing protein n=1 Tax=Acidithiobacillus sp. IBUN Pt1247-S3 TaxID=3166642 RepID=UPI0034E59395
MNKLNPLLAALLLALAQSSFAYAQSEPSATDAIPAASSTGKQPVTIGEVEKTAPPERGTGSLTKELVKHASPNENFQSILRNIPGFTVISTGPGNLTSSDSTFSYQGFNSDQMGVEFDGVPLINTFRGGITGQGDDHALTPIGMGQFSGVKVYSGANTPSETGINALGGPWTTHLPSPARTSASRWRAVAGSIPAVPVTVVLVPSPSILAFCLM